LEAVRHPRLESLVQRRNQIQRATFCFVAELGRDTGEFDNVLPLPELTEHLRVLVMGWLVERNMFEDSPLQTRGLLDLLGLTETSRQEPRRR
jgi:hypothetical protein